MNSDDNWAVFRRFGYLSTRALLQLQIELTDIEKEVEDLDNKDAADPILEKRLRGFRVRTGAGGGSGPSENSQWDDAHLQLLLKAKIKLCEYCECKVPILNKDSD